jgi:mRNA interferase MazF
VPAYIPEQGDFVVISFDPQAGHEQKGRLPGFVVSVNRFNLGTRLVFCCPITNTDRGTSFHVPVPAGSGLTGFVMCEQMKSIGYRARGVKRIGEASGDFLGEVLSVIDACLFTKPEGVNPNG